MADAESGGKGAGGARQTRHAARAAPPIDVEPLDGGWQRLDAWTPGRLDAWTPGCLDANMSVDDKDREGTDAAAKGVRKQSLRS